MNMIETRVLSYYSIVVSRIINTVKLFFFSLLRKILLKTSNERGSWNINIKLFEAQENWKIIFDHSE